MSPAPLIDSHCHLNDDYAPRSVADLIADARAEGVVALVTIGTEPATLGEIERISEAHPEVFHTAGFHPHEAAGVRDEDLARLAQAARHPRCRAIGEIGLDYHYDHSPREAQRKRLEDQLELALEAGLPVVIHSREAEEDLLRALTDYAGRLPEGAIPGIIHCFSGTRDFGLACVDLGFYISFSGILTFKNAGDLRECARAFPLDRLLVETDSPYLAPIPHRGKKCEPRMVKVTALKLAEVKALPFEAIAEATTRNARRVFKMAP